MGSTQPTTGHLYKNFQQQQNYRSTSGHQKGRQSFATIRKHAGDFHLIFPFNDATYKAACTGLEAKTVIRETQQKLKDILSAVVAAKGRAKSGGKVRSAFVLEPGNDGLWAPLKVVTDEFL
jgi:hypothetical protein